jgi:hypothetical protein
VLLLLMLVLQPALTCEHIILICIAALFAHCFVGCRAEDGSGSSSEKQRNSSWQAGEVQSKLFGSSA